MQIDRVEDGDEARDQRAHRIDQTTSRDRQLAPRLGGRARNRRLIRPARPGGDAAATVPSPWAAGETARCKSMAQHATRRVCFFRRSWICATSAATLDTTATGGSGSWLVAVAVADHNSEETSSSVRSCAYSSVAIIGITPSMLN